MTTKPYDNIPEGDSTKKVDEPAIAYERNMNLKAEVTKLIMNIDDPVLLQELVDELTCLAATSMSTRSPIQYTLEELKEQLAIAQEQSAQGMGISHDEVLKREPQWWMSK
ncbi:hypothetical protein M2459_003305 [Parabacteroides sp. PF5-5]|uniref:hypothetical protein n=1 Tax=unclassified Parabacteroides TaxID=2649774 RepID=UPI002474F187|nr:MULTISPECIES: hypothetical protein [unclassified Parabacteroides]MDH6306580.1 hypothetical protein [Parabacteroides sp. PH5-39]MDH6317547.1 hypothetical protein [Parabacteroides sp. PF5-13]MDH6321291.1 hypothetical protein [Parabacteroides sp. PH5-13]MDH6325023.1 hypothetical protein [Parabacteroides sp. PH5-8]MDH6328732.1 hypothetical protein [Parabacteroides sp. PH5-41]